jgi:hypothetical protein
MIPFSKTDLKRFKTQYYLLMALSLGFCRPKTIKVLKEIADELGL